MDLDIIKQNTTWNDAATSINSNFEKVRLALVSLEGASPNLIGLADVSVEALSSGDVLVWNGSVWKNAVLSDVAPDIDLSEYLTTAQADATYVKVADYQDVQEAIDEFKDWFYKTEDAIGTKYNFFSEQEVSANGLSSGTGGSGGGGLITQVYPYSSLGSIASESLTETFSAYAISKLANRVSALEQGGGSVDVDLSNYYTKTEIDTALSSYLSAENASTLYVSMDSYEQFEQTTNDAISDLQGRDEDLSKEIIALQTLTDNHTTQISGLTTRVTTNEGNIAKLLKWFAEDEDGNLYTTYNLYSTKEISANGLGQGSGGGGETYPRLDSWSDYDATAGAVLSAVLGYGLKTSLDTLTARVDSLSIAATSVGWSGAITETSKKIGVLTIDGISHSLYAPATYAWGEITDKPTFAAVATSGSYSDLSNKPTISSLMGTTAIGGTSSYVYWSGSEWTTKTLGSLAFSSATYAGGTKVSLNGTSKAGSSATFYAPTDAGTSGYLLKSNGTGNAPTWMAQSTLLSGYATQAWVNTQLADYLPLEGGTITGDLRLKGSGNYGNHLYFGDGSYCYLYEDTDDHLTIYGSKGITLSIGSNYTVSVDGALEATTVNGYTLKAACSRAVTTSVTSGSSSLITSGGVYSWSGTSNLTTVGTITTGIWNGTAIGVAYGGTGKTTLTSGYALVGNGTSAVSLRAITTSASSGSTSLITSGGVYTALSSYLPKSGGTIDGNLAITGTLGVTKTSTFTGKTTHNGGIGTTTLTTSSTVTIVSAVLSWDSTNSALKVSKPFYSTGEISANGFYSSSDMRFKSKVEDICLDLDTMANAPMFRFTWNNTDRGDFHIGSSAQYWEDHARELVSVGNDDFHRLDYSTLGVLMGVSLAKKSKNHEERIKELEKEVELLKEENRRMMYGN